MKGWRPPAWATEAAKQKKMALRERGKAQAAQQKGGSLPPHRPLAMMDTPPERLGLTSLGTAPTPQLPSLRDRLVSPEPGEVGAQEVVINQCPVTRQWPHHCHTPQSHLVRRPPPLRGRARASPSPTTTFHQMCHLSLPTPRHGHTSCTYGNWGGHRSRTIELGTECSRAHCGGAQSTVVRWTRCPHTLGPSTAFLSYRG